MFDNESTLLVDDERVYALIEKMFRTCLENYTSKKVHIGIGEAHWMGLGNYFYLQGAPKRHEMFLRHLQRVCDIAANYGLQPMIWSDMPFRITYGYYENLYDHYNGDESALDEMKKKIPQG